eukprot:scaffold4531_cov103-Cylindrotheca_fusiformis.AAC.6
MVHGFGSAGSSVPDQFFKVVSHKCDGVGQIPHCRFTRRYLAVDKLSLYGQISQPVDYPEKKELEQRHNTFQTDLVSNL